MLQSKAELQAERRTAETVVNWIDSELDRLKGLEQNIKKINGSYQSAYTGVWTAVSDGMSLSDRQQSDLVDRTKALNVFGFIKNQIIPNGELLFKNVDWNKLLSNPKFVNILTSHGVGVVSMLDKEVAELERLNKASLEDEEDLVRQMELDQKKSDIKRVAGIPVQGKDVSAIVRPKNMTEDTFAEMYDDFVNYLLKSGMESVIPEIRGDVLGVFDYLVDEDNIVKIQKNLESLDAQKRVERGQVLHAAFRDTVLPMVQSLIEYRVSELQAKKIEMERVKQLKIDKISETDQKLKQLRTPKEKLAGVGKKVSELLGVSKDKPGTLKVLPMRSENTEVITEDTFGELGDFRLAASKEEKDSDDKNLAREYIKKKTDIDAEIAKNIGEGKAARISLADIVLKPAGDIVNLAFRGTPQETAFDLQGLFGEMSDEAREKLAEQLSDDLNRERIRKSLILALSVLKTSKYKDKLTDHSLTLLLDWDGVFYHGGVLAHTGTSRKTVYLNLSTLMHIEEMEPAEKAFAKRVLLSVFEHEYRDWERSSNGLAPHQEDIGVIEPVFYQGEKITFKDVNKFWKGLENRTKEKIVQREVDGESEQYVAIKQEGLSTFVVSNEVLSELGIFTAGKFLSLLSRASALKGKKLSKLFSEKKQTEIVIDDIETFQNEYKIDLKRFSKIIPVEDLEPFESTPTSEIKHADQLRGLNLSSDYFIVSPVYNLLSRDDPALLGKIIKHAHENGYADKLVIVDDASTDGTQEFLKKINRGYNLKILTESLDEVNEQLQASDLSRVERKILAKRRGLIEQRLRYYKNPESPVYNFNMVLREENGHRTGAIRDTILGLYSLAQEGEIKQLPEKIFIMDGDSFIRGEDINAQLRDAADMIGNVDANGDRVISCILPVSTHYGKLSWLKSSFMEKVNYAHFTWLRSVSAFVAKSVPGGGGGYSLPYLVRALKKHSGVFETDDAELSAILRENKNTKFKFFASKTLRVITDMPEKISDKWTQSRRWAGGAFQMLRKYGRDLPKGMYGTTVKAMIVYALLSYAVPVFAIKPLIELIIMDGLSMLIPMGIFYSGVAYVVFMLPVIFFNKDAFKSEKIYSVLFAPIILANFIIFAIAASFAEFYLTVFDLLLVRPVKHYVIPFLKNAWEPVSDRISSFSRALLSGDFLSNNTVFSRVAGGLIMPAAFVAFVFIRVFLLGDATFFETDKNVAQTSLGVLLGAFIRPDGSLEHLYPEKAELDLIAEASTKSSTSPELLNVRVIKERVVESIESGQDVVSAYIKIQNFKDVWNTFGAEFLGQSHFLGDAGINAMGKVLKKVVEKEAKKRGMSVELANAGGEFFLAFSNVGTNDVNQILTDMLNREFSEKVRRETIKAFKKRLNNKKLFRQLELLLDEGFTLDKIGFYGGVSTNSRDHQESAPELSDILFTESFQAAKHSQLSFSDKFDNKIADAIELMKKGVSPDEIDEMFKDVLSESREALKTGVKKYTPEIDDLIKSGLLEREYQALQQSIADTYDPAMTIDSLLAGYKNAVETGASKLEISQVKDKLLDSVLRYETKNLKGEFIFVGNDHFKRVVNYILQNQPDHDVALTFRVGGDEYGKLVWDNNRKKMIIYRFDGNNVGATSGEWGMGIGDKLIDESLRVISLNKDIHNLPAEVTAFFNDMGTRAVPLNDKEYATIIRRAKDSLVLDDTAQDEDLERIKTEGKDLLVITDAIYKKLEGNFQEYTKDTSMVLVKRSDGSVVLMKFPDIHAPYVIEDDETEIRKSNIQSEELELFVLADKVGEEGVDAVAIQMMADPGKPGEFLINNLRGPPMTVTQDVVDGSKQYSLNFEGYKPVKVTISEDEYNYRFHFTDGKLISIPAESFSRLQQQGKIIKKNDEYAVLITTRPVVSSGLVEVDVDKISPEDLLRDISVIQGRADGAAEIAKADVKRYQIMNEGIIREESAVKNGVSLTGSVEQIAEEMSSFKKHEQSQWDKIVAEYILDKHRQQSGLEETEEAIDVDSERKELALATAGDKNLARRGVKGQIDAAIRDDVLDGNAIRISLKELQKGETPAQVVDDLFEGSPKKIAKKLQKLFGKLPANAVQKMVDRMSDPIQKEKIRNGLIVAFESIRQSKYMDELGNFSLTLLLDEKGVFYSGDALSHVGTERKTIYINLNTLLNVAEMEFPEQDLASNILRAVFEHEFRDWVRALILRDGKEAVKKDPVLKSLGSRADIDWFEPVLINYDTGTLTSPHADDIGVIDVITFAGSVIDFDLVDLFWRNITPKKDISEGVRQILSVMNFDNIPERSKIRTLQMIAEEYVGEQSKIILDNMINNYQMYLIVYSPSEAVRRAKADAQEGFEELRNSLYQIEEDYDVEFFDIKENVAAIMRLVDEFNQKIGFLRKEDSYRNLQILKSLNYRDLNEKGYLYLIRRVMDLKINMSVFLDVREDGLNLKAYEAVLKEIMALPDEIIADLPEWGNVLTLSQANWVDSSGRVNVDALYDGGVYVSLSDESKYSPMAAFIHEFIGHYRLMKLIEDAKQSDGAMIKLEETISPENIIDILKSCVKPGAESNVRFTCRLNLPDKYVSGPESVIDKFNDAVSESLKLETKDVFWEKTGVDLFVSDKALSADEQSANPVVLENISIEFLSWAAKNNKYMFWELVHSGMWFDLPETKKMGVKDGDNEYYTDILEIISFAVMDGEVPAKKLTNPSFQYDKKAVREILSQNYLKGWSWTQENGWTKDVSGLEAKGLEKLAEQKLIKTDEPLRPEIPMTESRLKDYLDSTGRHDFSKEILDGFKGYLSGLEERRDHIKSEIKRLGVDNVKYDGGMAHVEDLINGLIESAERLDVDANILKIRLPGIDKVVFVYLVDEVTLAKLDRASYTFNTKTAMEIFLPFQLTKPENLDTFFQVLKHQIDSNIYDGIKDQAVLLEPLFGTNKKAAAGDVSARVVYEFAQRIKNTKDLNKLNELRNYFKDIIRNKSAQLQKIRDSKDLTPEQQEVAESLVLNMARVAMTMSVKAETAIVEAGGEVRGFKFIDRIGEGTYSNVYLAEKDGVKYAVKVFKDKDGQYGTSAENVIFLEHHKKMEAEILQKAYEDTYVSGDYVNGESLFLVMPYMEGMALKEKIRHIPEEKMSMVYFTMNILSELRRRVGNKGIIHNDIKPHNILVSEDGNNSRILDFGASWKTGYVPLTLKQTAIAYTEKYASSETKKLKQNVLRVIKILKIVSDKSPVAEKADRFEQAFQSLLQESRDTGYADEFQDDVDESFVRLQVDVAGVVSRLRRGERVPFQQVVDLLQKDIQRVLFLTIDTRSDIYSFGKMLELDFFNKSGVSDSALDEIIAKATADNKADRYQSFTELEDDFYEYLEKADDGGSFDLVGLEEYMDKPPVDPSLSAQEIGKLNISDWVADDLMSEFEKMNNGRPLKTISVTGDSISLIDEIQAQLKDIDDDEYVSIIIHKQSPLYPEFGKIMSHKVAIDKAGRFKENMHTPMTNLMLYSYMYVMDFSVFEKMNDLHFHSVSLGREDDDYLRGRGLTSKTFEKIVKIFRSFYPYQISTFAISPSSEHWFKKHFDARHVDVEDYEELKQYIETDITDEEDYKDLMIGRIKRNPDPGDEDVNIADIGLDAPEYKRVNEAIEKARVEGRLEQKESIYGRKVYIVKGVDTLIDDQKGHADIRRNAIYVAENAYNQDSNLVLHEVFELQRWQDKAIELAKEAGIIASDKVVSDWIQDLNPTERAKITINLKDWISNNGDQAELLMKQFHDYANETAPVERANEVVTDDRIINAFNEVKKTDFSNQDLKDFILLYSDLPVTKLLSSLAQLNRTFDEFADDIYQKIQQKYGLGRDVKKATVLDIQDHISSLVHAELDKLGSANPDQVSIDQDTMVRAVISQAIDRAGDIENLIPQGLKAKIVDAGIEKIKKKSDLIKTTNPEKSDQLLAVYTFLKGSQFKLAVIPSMDGSYGISTIEGGYQFTYPMEVDGQRVVFVGQGLYDALLEGGIDEFLVHIGVMESQNSLPEASRLDEMSVNRTASLLRGYFGNTLSGLIEDLTFKGLENQRYMPLLDRIMSLGKMNIDKISLSPATINEIVTNLREIFDLEIDFDVSNLPDESQFKVSTELLAKSLSIINTAVAKPDIFLFPSELVTGKISPANFGVRQTLETFREENRNKEGRNAVFIAVSLDAETVSQFRDTLDKTIRRRESVTSNEIFDFVVNVKNVNELIDLIKAEYPMLSESDLLNRLKMIDTSSGKLSDYADKNGYRYQTFDSGLAMDSMRNTGQTVFLMDILRAFGTKKVPKNIKIVKVKEDVVIEESYQEQFSDLVSVFLGFISKLKAMPGKQWTYQQLTDTFYTDVYATLSPEIKAKFRSQKQVADDFRRRGLLDEQVGYDDLWKVFANYIKPDSVAGSDYKYFAGKLKEQQDLYVIKRVYENLNRIKGTVTIDMLLQGLSSIGTISINQNHAKYLQIEANARSVNSSVIDTINQISAIDESA